MMKTDIIFNSKDLHVLLIHSSGIDTNSVTKDYNPLPSISFPLSSYYEYRSASSSYMMHPGMMLYENAGINFDIKKPQYAKDVTLSFLIRQSDYDLGIPSSKTTKTGQRTVGIDYLLTELLQSKITLQKEDLCLQILDESMAPGEPTPIQMEPYYIHQVDEARHFVYNNYHQPITLSDIAQAACQSVFHFSRIFKQLMGCSPYQYLLRYRLEKAKRLLLTRTKVKQVAFEVGFNSLDHFSYAFRNYTGQSPRRYKESLVINQ